MRASGWLRGCVLLLLAVSVAVAGCFEPRRERPKDRINRLRLQYRVSAEWYENRSGKDGAPELVMSLRCKNNGKESFPQVTMVLHIRHFDGEERHTQALTLDVSKVPPGQDVALPEIVLPGLEVREGEELALQMEVQPTTEQMKTYPEYRELLSGEGGGA